MSENVIIKIPGLNQDLHGRVLRKLRGGRLVVKLWSARGSAVVEIEAALCRRVSRKKPAAVLTQSGPTEPPEPPAREVEGSGEAEG